MKFIKDGDIPFQLDAILNQGIDFGDNVSGGFFEITSTGAKQQVNHNLGRIPIGFLVLFKDADINVWAEDLSSWTKEILFLRTSASNALVRLFVM